jgi:hypothetical protein
LVEIDLTGAARHHRPPARHKAITTPPERTLAMACSEPICYLLHREAADGTEGMLMEPDLASALEDASDPAWRAVRITFGRQTVLEGEELATAIAERHGS